MLYVLFVWNCLLLDRCCWQASCLILNSFISTTLPGPSLSVFFLRMPVQTFPECLGRNVQFHSPCKPKYMWSEELTYMDFSSYIVIFLYRYLHTCFSAEFLRAIFQINICQILSDQSKCIFWLAHGSNWLNQNTSWINFKIEWHIPI